MTTLTIVDSGVARMTQGVRPVTDVAVGILIRATDQAVLLTTRPAGKAYAGYWEFPGGKVEAGEEIPKALERELYEEIGVNITTATPWRIAAFDYPHASVLLHFFKVTTWTGELTMLENQTFHWGQLPVKVTPILAGTLPVLKWLSEESHGATSDHIG